VEFVSENSPFGLESPKTAPPPRVMAEESMEYGEITSSLAEGATRALIPATVNIAKIDRDGPNPSHLWVFFADDLRKRTVLCIISSTTGYDSSKTTKKQRAQMKAKKSLGAKTPMGFARAHRALGQNFLIDQSAISDIVRALKVKKTDVIVEIGPGHGELTIPLLKTGAKVIAIEKDYELAQKLASSLVVSNKNLEIIDGDALDVFRNSKLEIRNSDKYKLVGNIPYYITGYLLRTIGELENKPEMIVLTIQKEVAERIAAKSPNMNLLAASVQFWGKPEIIKIIPRESFDPVPNVDSAVIRIVPSKKPIVNSDQYYRAIKILFRQPRKTILNNLKDAVKNEDLSASTFSKILKNPTIDPSLRPQNLSVEDIKDLAGRL